MTRRYSDAQVADAVYKAVMLGNTAVAAKRLHIPESTLRGWLKLHNYRVQQRRILDPLPGQEGTT